MSLLPLLLAAALADADPALIERLRRRDPQAMADLYDRYGKLVYSIIVRSVRDPGIAEDLTQETFLRVWNRAQAFDAQRGAFVPWLVTVARNRAIDYLRSSQGRMQNALEAEDTERPSAFVNMEPQLLDADQLRRVREALRKLNPNLQRVIELAYFEGLSQTEMAERIGEPLGTVKTRVRTALKSLRDQLAGAAAI